MLLVVGLVIDAVRRVASGVPPRAVRLSLFLWVYLAAEVVGLAALAAPRVASLGDWRRAWLRDVTRRVQQLWAGVLLGACACCSGCGSRSRAGDVVAPGPGTAPYPYEVRAPSGVRADDRNGGR